MVGGYTDEACAWREWLVNAVAGTPSTLQIMYGLGGERRLTELELEWLPGTRTRPRCGSATPPTISTSWMCTARSWTRCTSRADRGCLPVRTPGVCSARSWISSKRDWQKPDEGIWEVRGPQRQFTHSKVMAWVAMDRAVKSVEEFGLEGHASKWRQIRQQIHDEVCREGFDPALNSFVQVLRVEGSGCEPADASARRLPPRHRSKDARNSGVHSASAGSRRFRRPLSCRPRR